MLNDGLTNVYVDRLLAVDPSLSCTGYALFDCGELRTCGVFKTTPADPLRDRLGYAAGLLAEHTNLDLLVIEWPQIYARAKSKGDPNDLLMVAGVAAGILISVDAATVLMPTPHQWKGTTPKDIHNARVLKRLTAREASVLKTRCIPKTLENNAIDAIGLGLWALGRMSKHARAANQDQEAPEERSVAAYRRGAK